MTKENFTSINIVLDRSGSMKKLANDTIGGFNTFLSDQKKLEGEAIFTLATFSDSYSLVHDCIPIKDINDLTVESYQPSGYTALLDAVGRTINSTGAKLAAMPEEERPSRVIFVIMTDGEENASKEFTRSKILEMISHQKEMYSWSFVFLGANLDAVKEAYTLGITGNNSFTYDASAAGTKSTFNSISNNMSSYRNSANIGAANVDFFDQNVADKK